MDIEISKTMTLEEFESFAKEFFDALVDIKSDKSDKDEFLKIVAWWLISENEMRKAIQLNLNTLYELVIYAQDAQYEINDDYLIESLEGYNEQIR